MGNKQLKPISPHDIKKLEADKLQKEIDEAFKRSNELVRKIFNDLRVNRVTTRYEHNLAVVCSHSVCDSLEEWLTQSLKPIEDAGWFIKIREETNTKSSTWAKTIINTGDQNSVNNYTIVVLTRPCNESGSYVYSTAPTIYKEVECVVCTENKPIWYFFPCGHLCLCDVCKPERAWKKCLICNDRCEDVIYNGHTPFRQEIDEEYGMPISPDIMIKEPEPPKVVVKSSRTTITAIKEPSFAPQSVYPTLESNIKPKKTKPKKPKKNKTVPQGILV